MSRSIFVEKFCNGVLACGVNDFEKEKMLVCRRVLCLRRWILRHFGGAANCKCVMRRPSTSHLNADKRCRKSSSKRLLSTRSYETTATAAR